MSKGSKEAIKASKEAKISRREGGGGRQMLPSSRWQPGGERVLFLREEVESERPYFCGKEF